MKEQTKYNKPRVRRWTNNKLHMEIHFARAFGDYMPEAKDWRLMLEKERERRGLPFNFEYIGISHTS